MGSSIAYGRGMLRGMTVVDLGFRCCCGTLILGITKSQNEIADSENQGQRKSTAFAKALGQINSNKNAHHEVNKGN